MDVLPLFDNYDLIVHDAELIDGEGKPLCKTYYSLMHKNRVSQKRKIQVGYNGIKDSDAQTVLQAINPEYINVTYYDLMAGQNQTREFYVGDRSAPFKWWFDGKHILESLTFDLIER